MKAVYRGCKIESYRSKAMGGWDEVYWSAFSQDRFEITSGFGGGTVRDMYQAMKDRVDDFLDNYKGNATKYQEAKISSL